MSLQIETAQNVGLEYEIASVGERIAAQLIDYAVMVGWFLAVIALAALVSSIGDLFGSEWLMGIVLVSPVLFYTLLCEYFMEGQTLGKMALKIKVVRLDGGRASLSAYLLRWLFSLIDNGLFSGLVAVLTIIINGKGQRLGDIAAGTTVVRNYQTVRLSSIEIPELPEGYIPVYTNVIQLTDKDIRTIKKVMKQSNEELLESAADRVAKVLGVSYSEIPYNFLVDIVNDHLYYSTQDKS